MLRHSTKKLATFHHKEHPEVRVFCWIALIKSLGLAGFWTIFPLILNDMLQSESMVGIYYTLIAVVLFFVSILSTYLFVRFSKIRITKIMILVATLALLGMTLAKSFRNLALFDILRAIAISLVGIALSLFIREYSNNKALGANEGTYYLYTNIGWLVGPFIGGLCASFFGDESVFIFAGICFLITTILFFHQHMVYKNPHISNRPHTESIFVMFSHIKSFFSSRTRIQVFLIALGLNFWRAVSTIYIPLHIEQLGFSEGVLGFIISISILPLVLLEVRVGKKSDTWGLRPFLFTGFVLLAVFCAAFVGFEKFPIIMLVLFALANLGAAYIEPLQETFLFKSTTKEEGEKYYGIYNTSDPIANTFGPLLASGILVVWHNSLSAVWIGVTIVFCVFAAIAFRVKK